MENLFFSLNVSQGKFNQHLNGASYLLQQGFQEKITLSQKQLIYFCKKVNFPSCIIILKTNNFMHKKQKLKELGFFKALSPQTKHPKRKPTYSFSKSPRFQKNNPQCPTISYGGDLVKGTQSGVGIGYGIKSDFTKDLARSPGSAKYTLKSSFDLNKKNERGCTFGKGREEIIYKQYVNQQICRNPSPNNYRHENVFSQKGPIFSLRERTRLVDRSLTVESQNENPGPGQYHSSLTLKKISPRLPSLKEKRYKRFPNSDNKVPGPGTYKNQNGISDSSAQYLLRKKKAGFNQSRKMSIFDEAIQKSREIPGPGEYTQDSEFGECGTYRGLNNFEVVLGR